jgi:hypothetical protein
LALSETDDSLFREVDEEVRTEEYKKIWDRYGKYFTGLAVAAVACVAGFQAWTYYQTKQAEDASAVYLDAVKKAADGKVEDATAAFAAVHHDGFAQLSQLRGAAMLAEKGDVEKAVAAYDAFVGNAKSDTALANLARIRAGYALVDSATPEQLLARLASFDNEGNVWRNEAREILGLAAWRVKDYQGAQKYMAAIYADGTAPGAMRQRAQILIQLIAPNLPAK